MTIDEAISHAREVASRMFDDRVHCIKCAEEHGQLAEWLEELQQYRQIGTVEECREAVDKQTAKKPTLIDYKKYTNFVDNADFLQDAYWCPNCKRVVRSGSFCRDCGQHIDWSDEDGKTD